MMSEHEDRYFVVRNDEDQYSIWRVGKQLPDGWLPIGRPAAKDECLKRIGELWTDMRPASLRASMAAAGQTGG
jgi:MbtH protein